MNWRKHLDIKNIKVGDWVWVDKKQGSYDHFENYKPNYGRAKTDDKGVRLIVNTVGGDAELTLWKTKDNIIGDYYNFDDVYKVER